MRNFVCSSNHRPLKDSDGVEVFSFQLWCLITPAPFFVLIVYTVTFFVRSVSEWAGKLPV